MLEWTARGKPSLMLIVHHADAEREYAYTAHRTPANSTRSGPEAITKRWIVVDMKKDWKFVFPPDK